MTLRDRLKLAAIWIRVAKNNKISTKPENDALRTIYKLCQEKPHEAWQVIVTIAECDPSTSTATLLGRGPIREIMVYHGVRFMTFAEQSASKNQALQYAIDQVWRQKTFVLPTRQTNSPGIGAKAPQVG